MSTHSTPDAVQDVPSQVFPESPLPPQVVDNQAAGQPTRKELRDRALESRKSYQLGTLPGEAEGGEIDDALEQEAASDSGLGIAYRYLVTDDIPDEERIGALQEHSGHASPGTAIGLRQHLDALRFGIFPNGTSMARQIAARMKSVMRRHEFSANTRAVLDENVATLEEIATDTKLIEKEQSRADAAEQSIEDRLRGCPGVYVFTYPHYLRHPTHQSSEAETLPDRTLLKVGFTDKDILERVNQETNETGVPEHRRVLRAYLPKVGTGRTNREIERMFHAALDSAGHAGPKRSATARQRGGNEWFYTSLEFLDNIAELMDLEIVATDSSEHQL